MTGGFIIVVIGALFFVENVINPIEFLSIFALALMYMVCEIELEAQHD